ncbi:MAG: hydrogenase maturation nickel metallochaperone HypA [Hyphomicrobiaceae bacterium]|nr:hydrogenase maturation nickel metallochaperone HypA [Hyphomicrobiaceae bacterium]MCC0023113.1 hydrogenase maturation nickel metallochaperone HypA [Hyphomicrobiaceae bacterium]
MHELSVCQGLIGQVERLAAEHKAERVTRILVLVGPLSGVEAPLLERAFTIARMGTLAEDAELEVHEMPVRVWCDACREETEASLNRLVCGKCGDWHVTLRSGDELLLKSVALDIPEEEPAEAG